MAAAARGAGGPRRGRSAGSTRYGTVGWVGVWVVLIEECEMRWADKVGHPSSTHGSKHHVSPSPPHGTGLSTSMARRRRSCGVQSREPTAPLGSVGKKEIKASRISRTVRFV